MHDHVILIHHPWRMPPCPTGAEDASLASEVEESLLYETEFVVPVDAPAVPGAATAGMYVGVGGGAHITPPAPESSIRPG
jgi:hypothetical protein